MIHRIRYTSLNSPVPGEMWMVQQDEYDFTSRLMVCRPVEGAPFCRYYPLASRTHVEVGGRH